MNVGGSSLSLGSMLTGLMKVASIPLTNYQHQQGSVQTEISAYAQLKSDLSTFQSSLNTLTLAANFKALAATSSDSGVATAKVFTGAQPGNYTVNVSQLAQAQTLVSEGQKSVSTAIGSGADTTLTINLGTVGATTSKDDSGASTTTGGTADAEGHYADGTTFTPGGTSKTIKINSSNNTLGGIRDAINGAAIGVTASIVNDGGASPYRLVLTNSATGAAQAMQVTAKGDDAVGALLGFDPAGTQAMKQTTAAQDAQLSVNGISLNSPSNTVSSALSGFTLALSKVGATTLSVVNDTSTVESNVGGFVDAYNTLANSLSSLTNYDANDSSKNGILLGDSTTRDIKSALQRIVTGSIDGGSGLNTLADVGIGFSNDGTLAVDEPTLQSALQNNLTGVASLFGTNGTTTDNGVTYLNAGSGTQAGKYDIRVTQAATQGALTGTAAADLEKASIGPLSLTVTVDGTTQNIALPQKAYASAGDAAAALQNAINGNAAFTASGASVNVAADDQGTLSLTSTSYGAGSRVSVAGNGAQTLFGDTSVKGSAGLDVKGSIGGFAGTGSGQTLLGQPGTAVAGLSVQVGGDGTGPRGSVSYSVGFAAQLSGYIDNATGTTGAIANATKTLDTRVASIGKQITSFQSHLSQVQANYQTQFSALNTLSTKMKTASTVLNAQFNNTSKS
ncbi:flagellar filament capping protein FliD [Robbsia sp. Bb-Pol-6]|uniref:Flagellar hook-associated protein 2 n=2 Tax=Robbsia betulipollinis TaxID=2981849 RepID=A0ABT3ZHG8_9BURK|nr:flagellar filament capping protein FliD [Robbsia betulipollinis]